MWTQAVAGTSHYPASRDTLSRGRGFDSSVGLSIFFILQQGWDNANSEQPQLGSNAPRPVWLLPNNLVLKKTKPRMLCICFVTKASSGPEQLSISWASMFSHPTACSHWQREFYVQAQALRRRALQECSGSRSRLAALRRAGLQGQPGRVASSDSEAESACCRCLRSFCLSNWPSLHSRPSRARLDLHCAGGAAAETRACA